jgi:hypothetical protein
MSQRAVAQIAATMPRKTQSYGKRDNLVPARVLDNLADNAPIFASRFASVIAGDISPDKAINKPEASIRADFQMTHSEPAHENAEGEESANRITYNRKRFFLLLLPGDYLQRTFTLAKRATFMDLLKSRIPVQMFRIRQGAIK